MRTFMAPDVMHQFKQNSDFLYLTGFKETESVLVISRSDSDLEKNTFRTALFVKDKNSKTELWDGPVTGPKLIPKLCGIDYAYPVEDFKNYLDSLIKETNSNKRVTLWRYPTNQVYKLESGPNCFNEDIENDLDTFIGEQTVISNKLIDMCQQDSINASSSASYFNSSRYFVQLCRVKKSQAEIEIMQNACNISSEAFINSMKISHPFINESLINAKFDFDCRIRGSEHLAYIPVIAGGPRATVLHYIRNNQIINNDQMVLMDAGCQYSDYAR
jgi:Xaa-Pro aminopeptidase